jgi:uncharacterized protein (UPF0333 family)
MKKGQAAMEFLMTYGWAILVVLAAIGALAYFGVLSPSKLLPSKCTLSPGFDIKDCKASTTGFQMTLFNGLGVDAKTVSVNITTTTGSDVTCELELPVTPDPLGNGAVSDPLTFCGGTGSVFESATEGSRFDADVRVFYTKSGETLPHTVTGKIQIKVER